VFDAEAENQPVIRCLRFSTIILFALTGYLGPAIGAETELESLVDGLVSAGLERHGVRGGAVSVVYDGEVVLAKGYGFADAAGQRAVDAERTVFRIASLSKLFVATAVMQLVERRQLDLDTDVNEYLEGTGVRIPPAFDTPVTLRHLLTHTGGFEDVRSGYYRDKKDVAFDLATYLAEFAPERVRAPGQAAVYSSWSSSTAGLIVQNVSGDPYNEYVTANILQPLKMHYSTLAEPLPSQMAEHLSAGMVGHDGEFREMPFETIRTPSGAMSSSAADMARFMLMHLAGGRLDDVQVLQDDTVATMHSQAFTARPGYPGMAIGFIEQGISGRRQIGHHGVTAWFRSLLTLDTDSGVGVFVAMNGPRGFDVSRPLTKAILERFHEQDAPSSVLPSLEPPKVDVARYEGSYRPARHNETTLKKVGALFTPEFLIRADGRSGLQVRSGNVAERYVVADKDLFLHQESGEYIAIVENDDTNRLWFSDVNSPTNPAYRLAWWESNRVQLRTLAACVVLFLSVTAILIGSHFRTKPNGEKPSARHWVMSMCLAYIAFVVAAVLSFGADGNAFNTGWPLGVVLALALPVIGAVLTVPAGFTVVQDWGSRSGSRLVRLTNTIGVAASILFLLILNYWNALGWRLGGPVE